MALSDAALVTAANAVNTATTHLGLHSGAPGAAGTSNVVGSRVAIGSKAVDADGDISWTNTNFTGLTANQSVTHVSYWTASSGGTFNGSSALTGDTTANAAGEYSVPTVTENFVGA